MPQQNDHDWYVIVKIKMPDDQYLGQTDLEHYAQDVADSLHPPGQFESTYVVFHNGFGQIVRPGWAVDHTVTK